MVNPIITIIDVLQPMSTPERVVDLSNVPHELLRDTSGRLSDGSRLSSTSGWDTDTRRKSLTANTLSSNTNVSKSFYFNLLSPSSAHFMYWECVYVCK